MASRLVEVSDGFGDVVYSNIDALLRDNGLALADVECLAAASGPGSFTGVRVGLTAAKALAEALARPIVAVSNLAALAAGGAGGERAAVIDARRGEVYAALYDDALNAILAPAVLSWERFAARLEGRRPVFVAATEAILAPDGPAPVPADARKVIVPAPVEWVARLAARRLAAGEAKRPEEIDAEYLRRPDAERNRLDRPPEPA